MELFDHPDILDTLSAQWFCYDDGKDSVRDFFKTTLLNNKSSDKFIDILVEKYKNTCHDKNYSTSFKQLIIYVPWSVYKILDLYENLKLLYLMWYGFKYITINGIPIIYRLKTKPNNNTPILLFHGIVFGYDFLKILNHIVDRDVDLILPVYPMLSYCEWNDSKILDKNKYFDIIYNYLKNRGYTDLNIIAWSYGGQMNANFLKYIVDKDIKVKNKILIEPIGDIITLSTGCRLINDKNTLSYMNMMSKNKNKFLMTMFYLLLHTYRSHFTTYMNDSICNFELNDQLNSKETVLLLSTDDPLVNPKLLSPYISKYLPTAKIYESEGTHCNWLYNDKLTEKLQQIIKEQFKINYVE
jgi:hypothetical protein